MGISYNPSIVRTGLVMYLDAANGKSYPGSGTLWTDLTGTGNNGTLTNGPTFNSANLGSIVFDGSNDTVIISDNNSLQLTLEKTLSCWVYMGATSTGCKIVGKATSSALGMALTYGWSSGGFQAAAWNATSLPSIAPDASRDVAKWVFLTGVQTATTRFVYALDSAGLRSSSLVSTAGQSWNNGVNFTLGLTADGGSPVPANTRIAGVMVYNRALSLNEVNRNFRALRGRFGL